MFFEALNEGHDNLVFTKEKGSQIYGSSNICSQEWCYVKKALRKNIAGIKTGHYCCTGPVMPEYFLP